MTISVADSEYNTGSGTSCNPGGNLTLTEGNILVYMHHSNGTQTATADFSYDYELFNESNYNSERSACWIKIIGASESQPTSTLSSSRTWNCHAYELAFTEDEPDLSAVSATLLEGASASDTFNATCTAIDGMVIPNGAGVVITGQKDGRPGGNVYTDADNGFGSVLGSGAGQSSASAFKYFATGETFSGNVIIDTIDDDDNENDPYAHYVFYFVEPSSGSTLRSLPLLGVGT